MQNIVCEGWEGLEVENGHGPEDKTVLDNPDMFRHDYLLILVRNG